MVRERVELSENIAANEAVISYVSRLRKEPIFPTTSLIFTDPFSHEVSCKMAEKALDNRHLLGPIGTDNYGQSLGTTWEACWSTSLALALAAQSMEGGKYVTEVEEAIAYIRPYLYFRRSGSQIGMYAKAGSGLAGGDDIIKLKNIVPTLMGNRWDALPPGERLDYWHQKHPPIIDRFLDENSVYVVEEPLGVVMTSDEKQHYLVQSTGYYENIVGAMLEEETPSGASAEEQYLMHLCEMGALELQMGNPWVKNAEWKSEYRQEIVQYLISQFLPNVFDMDERYALALSIPNE
jgi:hypothetical protein